MPRSFEGRGVGVFLLGWVKPMHAVDDMETVMVAGVELMRVELQLAPSSPRNEIDLHDNVWALRWPRGLTEREREDIFAWATRKGAALLGVG